MKCACGWRRDVKPTSRGRPAASPRGASSRPLPASIRCASSAPRRSSTRWPGRRCWPARTLAAMARRPGLAVGGAAPPHAGHAARQRHGRQPATAAGGHAPAGARHGLAAALWWAFVPGVALLALGMGRRGRRWLASGRAGAGRAGGLWRAAGPEPARRARHARRGAARLGRLASLALLWLSAAAGGGLWLGRPLLDRAAARAALLAAVFGVMGLLAWACLCAAAHVRAGAGADERRQLARRGGRSSPWGWRWWPPSAWRRLARGWPPSPPPRWRWACTCS